MLPLKSIDIEDIIGYSVATVLKLNQTGKMVQAEKELMWIVYNIHMLANQEKLNAILILCSCGFLQGIHPRFYTVHDATTPLHTQQLNAIFFHVVRSKVMHTCLYLLSIFLFKTYFLFLAMNITQSFAIHYYFPILITKT